MAEPAASTRSVRRAALNFIFVTVALDMMALGIVIPVLPRLVVELAGDKERGVLVFGVFVVAWEAMQFLFAPILGALSDRHGRRPVVLLSNLGLGLDYVLMAFAGSLPLLFVGRVISGITSATFPVASAYIADVLPPEKRARGFGMLGAAFGIGFVIGPGTGGVLGSVHPRLPFLVAAAFSLANAAYGLFVLPESLPREARAPFSWARANPLGSLGMLRRHRELTGLATSAFLANLAHFVLQTTFVLYTAHRYGWGELKTGLTLAGVGVSTAIVQARLVGPAVARFGERRALVAGLLFGALGFAAYGLAPTEAWFWGGLVVTSMWGLAGPSAQALMSKRIGPSEQGQLQGALGSLAAAAGMIGPAIFSPVYAWAIGRGARYGVPGAAFLVASALLVAAMAVAAYATRARPESSAAGAA